MLHMSQQLSCRDMCNIVTCFFFHYNQNWSIFRKISVIGSFVECVPGLNSLPSPSCQSTTLLPHSVGSPLPCTWHLFLGGLMRFTLRPGKWTSNINTSGCMITITFSCEPDHCHCQTHNRGNHTKTRFGIYTDLYWVVVKIIHISYIQGILIPSKCWWLR